ncbi:hypothetical protein PPERSA_07232 [Pseudocohnilembus persalinus]|uniref:Insulin-like growth factor binding protein, N-terminal n=1 Tax=Pseudocohnilembus persalinus TaxID=266149 RepID=A0A0V0QCV5_PSEPJ|nr:hypothetical protein PPERSA_07232 [Pseudocohnilembus persalinus]|eukprot:KRX00035.1 hypothetical protein PPERSA_07232 [Pseudocohnilembus persalinus]
MKFYLILFLAQIIYISYASSCGGRTVVENQKGTCNSCYDCFGDRTCEQGYCCGQANVGDSSCNNNDYAYTEGYYAYCYSDCDCNGHRVCVNSYCQGRANLKYIDYCFGQEPGTNYSDDQEEYARERKCVDNYCCGQPNIELYDGENLCFSRDYQYEESYDGYCENSCECKGFRLCENNQCIGSKFLYKLDCPEEEEEEELNDFTQESYTVTSVVIASIVGFLILMCIVWIFIRACRKNKKKRIQVQDEQSLYLRSLPSELEGYSCSSGYLEEKNIYDYNVQCRDCRECMGDRQCNDDGKCYGLSNIEQDMDPRYGECMSNYYDITEQEDGNCYNLCDCEGFRICVDGKQFNYLLSQVSRQ